MDTYYKDYRASSHRAMYASAVRATKEVEKVRVDIAHFIDAQEEEVIFTSGSTAAAQLLVATLEHNLKLQEGDEIVVTELDHHATFVPLQMLAQRKKMKLTVVPADEKFRVTEEAFAKCITPRTKIVSLIHASNVTGTIIPVERYAALAHENGAFVIIDAAQTAGHITLSFKKLGADALFFSGHKMCGPTGVGVLALKQKWIERCIPPYGGGGTVHSVDAEKTIFLPHKSKFEAGTLPIAEIIGLGKAVAYIQGISPGSIQAHSTELVAYALSCLGQKPWVSVYVGEDNVGVVSFSIAGVHPHDIAHIFAEHSIAVRAGFQCAELISRKLSSSGVVRISVYGYTTKEDIDACMRALDSVQKTFSI